MASLTNVVVFATLLALAGAQSKTAAVDKVISMLEDLTKKVLAEGESEAASYNKFACFCKTQQSKKAKSIVVDKDEVASDSATISKMSSDRTKLNTAIQGNEKVVKEENEALVTEASTNEKAIAAYATNVADLSKAISSIDNAIKMMKGSKPSLLQVQAVQGGVEEALAMADALGFGVEGSAPALLQGAPMENYKFHSDSTIKMLEGLQTKFRTQKENADKTEVARLAAYKLSKQAHNDQITGQTVEMGNNQKAKAGKVAGIASNFQELSQEDQPALLSDQEYQNNLFTMCKKKAVSWDKRSKVRADELAAIAAATTIIKNTVKASTSKATLRFAQRGVTIRLAQAVARDADAMSAVEAEAEEKDAAAPTQSSGLYFLQRRSVTRHASDDPIYRASELLKRVADKTHSTMLAGLVSSISEEKPVGRGMEKVKTLIQELISRLQAQSEGEATQKAWCDTSLSKANSKKDTTTNAINELEDEKSKLEADIEILVEKLKTTADNIAELDKAQSDANADRKKENADNAATVKEANDGLAALNVANNVLTNFYKNAKAGADTKLDATDLLQKSAQQPAIPDSGFEDDYSGQQSASTGILGMLDIIKSDFQRTVKETERAEVESVQDHTAFTDQTAATKKEQEAIQKARTGEKGNLDAALVTCGKDLDGKKKLLGTTNEELEDLRKSCIDTGMSVEERFARRQQEIAALTNALCILGEDSNKCEE